MSRLALKADEYQSVGQESTDEGYSAALSHYDIPREVSIEVDGGSVVHIRFQYDDEEEATEQGKVLNEHIRLMVGKYSGKILSIEIDAVVFEPQTAADSIRLALAGMIPLLTKFNQRANYRVISSILSKDVEPLFREAEKYLQKNTLAPKAD